MTTTALTTITGLLGALGVTAIGAAGAAYLFFRYLGDKWLSAKFNQRLESFKHAQQRELEQLRLRINTTFDRTVKLHTQEFEVLPDLWDKLNDAFNHVVGLTHPYQEYPDLDRLSPAAFEHFLSESKLPPYHQDELKGSSERTKTYQSLRFWQSFKKVSEQYRAFNRYFNVKSIFIQPALKEPIKNLSDMMWDALLEKEMEERDPQPRPGRWEKGTALRKDGPALRDKIGEAIQSRLWDSASLPAADFAGDLPA